MAGKSGLGVSASVSWLLIGIIAIGVIIWKKKGS